MMKEPLLDHDSSSLPEATSSKSLFTNAGLFSKITFSWMGPLLDLGKRKTLDLNDVPLLDDSDSVHGIVPKFKSKIASISATGKYTDVTAFKLAKALVLTTWKLIIVTAVYALLRTVTSYVGPYLIEYFVSYLNESPRSTKRGYLLVLAFVVAQLVEGLSSRHLLFRSQQLGVRVRAALIAIIYQKGLSLSSQSRQGSSSGELINVVNLDAECVGDFNWSMHELWLLPVQITLSMIILYSTLGLAAFAALAATVLTMLANIPLGRIEQNYQEKTMNTKDARMNAMSEILQNMHILKLQGWELIFLSKIKDLRKVEMNWIKKYVYSSSMLMSVFFGAPAFVAMITFGACILFGIPLETGKVLSALATFRQLQGPIHSLPDSISSIISTKVSLDRICSFLRLEELSSNAVTKLPSGSTDISIDVSNGCFSWDTSSQVPTLQDLNFRVQQGKRVAICGTVGSGKSSLLSCILGEIPKLLGEECLLGFLASKTVVYVTHHVEFLPSADLILVMRDGKITQSGDYNEILKSGEELMELVGSHKDALSTLDILDCRSGNFDSASHPGGNASTLFTAEDKKYDNNDEERVVQNAIVSSLCIFMRSHLLVMGGCKTATILFEKMHECIFRAPMSFFDSTPSGRILNRASTDQSTVDTRIFGLMGYLLFPAIEILGTIVLMSQVAWPVFIIFIPIIIASLWYQQYYIDAARELQRLIGVSRAPVMQHFAESIAGSSIIRCFQKERQFISFVGHLMDNLSRPSLYNAAAMEWLCFRLDILSFFIFSFTLTLLVSSPAALINPKTAGLAVTYGLSLNMLQGWAIAILCSLENRMISVERILQYMNIPSEPPLTISESRPNCQWPTEGEIELHNLHVRYAPQLPFVLKGLTCTLPGGKKTGDSEAILIPWGSIAMSKYGRHWIPVILGMKLERMSLSLIRQVRYLPEGQRQLVCLGRVILKRRKILILDEATSSVDPITDNLIQKTFKRQFAECTMITIAHRITSVLDSDKVLLLDNGEIAEHDTPAKLLEDSSSYFPNSYLSIPWDQICSKRFPNSYLSIPWDQICSKRKK
ncbi:unnamed protein product [Urochloa decumbens]|uniref:Uncharacterized protein n=1 Tax=Urochloa decumbens TaxID=240449 RepID=A0ABC9EZH0_9POAL